jgi:hypothetical protein
MKLGRNRCNGFAKYTVPVVITEPGNPDLARRPPGPRPETTLPCRETPGSAGACFGSANSAALRRAAAANGKFALEQLAVARG